MTINGSSRHGYLGRRNRWLLRWFLVDIVKGVVKYGWRYVRIDVVWTWKTWNIVDVNRNVVAGIVVVVVVVIDDVIVVTIICFWRGLGLVLVNF